MNEFLKENKHTSTESILNSYRKCIVKLDALIERVEKDKDFSNSNKNELSIFLSNYSSGTKTIVCRYLQYSEVANQRIINMSATELFVKYKRELIKDFKNNPPITTELHLIVFDLRNKLNHNIDQIEYLNKVINESGLNKVLGFLNKISKESKEIYNTFENKYENHKEKLKENEQKKQKEIQREHYPFGIKY